MPNQRIERNGQNGDSYHCHHDCRSSEHRTDTLRRRQRDTPEPDAFPYAGICLLHPVLRHFGRQRIPVLPHQPLFRLSVERSCEPLGKLFTRTAGLAITQINTDDFSDSRHGGISIVWVSNSPAEREAGAPCRFPGGGRKSPVPVSVYKTRRNGSTHNDKHFFFGITRRMRSVHKEKKRENGQCLA